MVSEVWRPPGRAQIEKKRAPKPVQKTAPKFVRFFAISGAQKNPKWLTWGAWGATGSEKMSFQKNVFY